MFIQCSSMSRVLYTVNHSLLLCQVGDYLLLAGNLSPSSWEYLYHYLIDRNEVSRNYATGSGRVPIWLSSVIFAAATALIFLRAWFCCSLWNFPALLYDYSENVNPITYILWVIFNPVIYITMQNLKKWSISFLFCVSAVYVKEFFRYCALINSDKTK